MRKISLSELAKQLGVSKTLVSLVLNGKGDAYGISAETQEKVKEAAARLNYRPNRMARGLRTGQTNVIGLVVADISNPFYSRITRSIEDHAAAHGYNLICCSSEEDTEKEKRLVDMLVHEYNVSGLIVSTTQSTGEQFSQLRKEHIPFVLIDRNLPRLETNYVGVDNARGAYEATMHLIRSGYKRIGLLTISPQHLSTIRERAEGYKNALKKAGIRFDKKICRDIPFDTMRESVYAEMQRLVSPPHSVEAIFLVNNNLTAYALEYLQEAGLRVPQDIAIVSFDDVEYFRFSNPPVTAVEQPLQEIGAKAVEILMGEIKSGDKQMNPKQIILQANLIIRKSCGSFLKAK